MHPFSYDPFSYDIARRQIDERVTQRHLAPRPRRPRRPRRNVIQRAANRPHNG